MHRLRPGGREVDDGKAGVAKSDTRLGVNEDPARIGPAMGKLPRHGSGERRKLLGTGAAPQIDKARDAAHDAKPSPPSHHRPLPTRKLAPKPALASPRAA